MRKIRTYREVDHETGSGVLEQVVAQRERLARRLSRIREVTAVLSGKGGVGKSAVTANLAAALARRGRSVGVLDADLNGPSMARMLGAAGRTLGDDPGGVVPPEGTGGVRLMSMELLQERAEAPVRWKGPEGEGFVWQSTVETGALREFLSDVQWGELDHLLVDVPPGTDKIARLLDLLPGLRRALMVTTPSEMSRFVVSRSVELVRQASVPEVALVVNMTEFVCPDCGGRHPLFPGEAAEELAGSASLEVWCRIPFDPAGGAATDRGRPPAADDDGASPMAVAFRELADRLDREPGPEDVRP